ncbi:MAG: SIS domain-containing protein [Angelakisella sp.]
MMTKKNSEITYREIYQQSRSFQAINETLPAIYSVLDTVFADKSAYDELIFTGCGTSLYLAQTAAHLFSTCCTIPAKAVPCSELYFFPETFVQNRRVLVLPITRKSYTTEVRLAIDKVRSFPNVKSLAITCDKDSSLYNDFLLLSPETDEDSVIMTRSFTSMVYLATVLALYVGGKKNQIEQMAKGYEGLADRQLKAADALAKKIIAEHGHLNLFITLGQGVNYGIANECMNKMKEMGLTNSEAYYSLEYRHGPMSLVDENTLILMLSNDQTVEHDAALLDQMKTMGAVTAAIGAQVSATMPEADYHLELDGGLNTLQYAAVIGLIGQFMGYYIAQHKGIDADTPRHLSQAIILEK